MTRAARDRRKKKREGLHLKPRDQLPVNDSPPITSHANTVCYSFLWALHAHILLKLMNRKNAVIEG